LTTDADIETHDRQGDTDNLARADFAQFGSRIDGKSEAAGSLAPGQAAKPFGLAVVRRIGRELTDFWH
jgi:hypothetical protein